MAHQRRRSVRAVAAKPGEGRLPPFAAEEIRKETEEKGVCRREVVPRGAGPHHQRVPHRHRLQFSSSVWASPHFRLGFFAEGLPRQ